MLFHKYFLVVEYVSSNIAGVNPTANYKILQRITLIGNGLRIVYDLQLLYNEQAFNHITGKTL